MERVMVINFNQTSFSQPLKSKNTQLKKQNQSLINKSHNTQVSFGNKKDGKPSTLPVIAVLTAVLGQAILSSFAVGKEKAPINPTQEFCSTVLPLYQIEQAKALEDILRQIQENQEVNNDLEKSYPVNVKNSADAISQQKAQRHKVQAESLAKSLQQFSETQQEALTATIAAYENMCNPVTDKDLQLPKIKYEYSLTKFALNFVANRTISAVGDVVSYAFPKLNGLTVKDARKFQDNLAQLIDDQSVHTNTLIMNNNKTVDSLIQTFNKLANQTAIQINKSEKLNTNKLIRHEIQVKNAISLSYERLKNLTNQIADNKNQQTTFSLELDLASIGEITSTNLAEQAKLAQEINNVKARAEKELKETLMEKKVTQQTLDGQRKNDLEKVEQLLYWTLKLAKKPQKITTEDWTRYRQITQGNKKVYLSSLEIQQIRKDLGLNPRPKKIVQEPEVRKKFPKKHEVIFELIHRATEAAKASLQKYHLNNK